MEWVVNSTTQPLYPWVRHGTHCTGGWVSPKAGLDECGKFHPHRDSNPGPPNPWVYVEIKQANPKAQTILYFS